MERNIFEKQRELNDRLNRYRDEYYNRNAPSVSDEVYDRLFDELKELEQETGIQMANSPTQTVGYPAVSRLEKTRHEIPLLSLDKTMMSIQKPAVAEHSEDRVQDNPFVGKTIVVTGKVEPYTRDGINDLIESLGAHAGSSVSKKTDYLVCGENAGSKLSKARDLGVTVLSPAEFFSMAGAE